jgi:hypothetical protein
VDFSSIVKITCGLSRSLLERCQPSIFIIAVIAYPIPLEIGACVRLAHAIPFQLLH